MIAEQSVQTIEKRTARDWLEPRSAKEIHVSLVRARSKLKPRARELAKVKMKGKQR